VNPPRAGCEHEEVRHPLLTLIAIVALPGALTACGGGKSSTAPSPTPIAATLHGAVPSTEAPRPDFQLVDTDANAYDFAARTRGRLTLLYFGYTHCPDECPTSMADVAQALRTVPPDIARQVTVVFATTDPWRDSRPVLRRWLDTFHPPQPYVGLTGSPTQIADAEVRMGMPISKRESAPKGSGVGKYAVEHFAAVMVFGRDDRLKTLYPSGVAPDDIAADLKVLVKG
jgi:protein SCO1